MKARGASRALSGHSDSSSFHPTVTSVERELRSIQKHSSRKLRPKKSSHRSHSRSRSGSSSSTSSRKRELRALRDSIKALRANPHLRDLSEPIHPLEDFISSPKKLLSEAWCAVGLDELLNLVPLSLLDSCRRRERKHPPRSSCLPSNWPPFPASECSRGQYVRGLSDLWCRCLEELERIPQTELAPLMSGDKDPFSIVVASDPMALVDQSVQVTFTNTEAPRPSSVEGPCLHPADSTTNVIEPAAQDAVQKEILELEMRARAIRAMLNKSKN
uniref:Uncharacterized protein n=2 Tax=Schistocephalus solidus TaxID=70667 RepID=A0A0V0JCT7_SCHSO